MSAALDSLRLATALYLLLLALAACLDLHGFLLGYPFRIIYSGVRLVVGTVTLGRVNLVPMGRRVQRRSVRRMRDWRYELQEWRDQRAEKAGRDPMAGGWATAADTRNYDAVPESVAPVAPYASVAAEPITPYSPTAQVEEVGEPQIERDRVNENRALFYEQDDDPLPPPSFGADADPSPPPAAPVAPVAAPPSNPPVGGGLSSLWDEDEDELPPPLD